MFLSCVNSYTCQYHESQHLQAPLFLRISTMLIARLETVNLTVFRERGFYLGVARL